MGQQAWLRQASSCCRLQCGRVHVLLQREEALLAAAQVPAGAGAATGLMQHDRERVSLCDGRAACLALVRRVFADLHKYKQGL